MLNTLPPELVLNVLSYVCVRTLYNVQLVNKDWAVFIAQNANVVYRYAAIYHGFVEPSQTLDDASSDWYGIICPSNQVFEGWKDFCRRRFQVEYNWEGRGSMPKETMFRATGKDVHRFKVDERQHCRFIITTHRRGGLKVICMDTDAVLFELSKQYVRSFAHCEYENGFLIFDRFHPHALEIWRLSNDWDGSIRHINERNAPDEAQISAPRRYLEPGTSATCPGRGAFSPWALFTPEHSPRAYRFVYPSLLIGSEWGQELYIFDVPSATLEETIPLPNDALPQGANGLHINYVELGPRHCFVCTPFGVLILPRRRHHHQRTRARAKSQPAQQQNGGFRSTEFTANSSPESGDDEDDREASPPRFLDFPSCDPGLRVPQLVRHYAARMVQSFGPPSNPAMREFIVTAPHVPEQTTAVVRLGEDRQEFSAVHVSRDGKDFVAITIFGVAYFVRGFERVFRREASFSDITLRTNMGTSALNLAFDHDRVVIQTIHGVFLFNLHTRAPYGTITPHQHTSQLPPQPEIFPQLSAHQLLHFRNPLPLRLVSCVKLTKTGVWLDWSARAMEEVEGRVAPLPDEDDGDAFGGNDEAVEVEEEHPYATKMVCRVDFAPRNRDRDTDGEMERERRYMQY